MKNRMAPALLILVASFLLYGAFAYGIYTNVTSHVLGANDFYSRWVGARALLLRHADPYTDAVTREIQMGMYGRLARPDEDQVAFAYPLYAAFVAAPLVALNYAMAQALWMAFLLCAVAVSILSCARLFWPSVTPGLAAGGLIAGLIYYPSVRAIFLGQYAVFSFSCLVMAIYAVDRRQDWIGGILLAAATVKPQPAILIVPAILIWAMHQSRWQILVGALAAGMALVASGMLFVPAWPLEFIQAIRRYAVYEPVGPPLQIAIELVLPRSLAAAISSVGAIVLGIAFFALVVRRAHQSWAEFSATLGLAAILTTLIAGRVGTSDQVILLLPWMQWVGKWLAEGRRLWLALTGLALALPWAVFLVSLRGNYEQPTVALVLPGLALAVLLMQRRCARKELIGVAS